LVFVQGKSVVNQLKLFKIVNLSYTFHTHALHINDFFLILVSFVFYFLQKKTNSYRLILINNDYVDRNILMLFKFIFIVSAKAKTIKIQFFDRFLFSLVFFIHYK
jgi:hypothetical protein